jgi:hypothetical protein
VGQGSAGNVAAHQISQLLTRPLGVAGVDNPLAVTGGIDGDGPDTVLANATVGVRSQGRLVTLGDYVDVARAWPTVGKAASAMVFDGRQTILHLSIAGSDPVALASGGPVAAGIQAQMSQGAAGIPVTVAPAELALIILGATVAHDPGVDWSVVESAVRAALLDAFGYSRRALAQDVLVSALSAAAHSVGAVRSFTVDSLAVVASSAAPSTLAGLAAPLSGPVPPAITVPGASLRILSAPVLAQDSLAAFAARNSVSIAQVVLANPQLDQVVFTGIAPDTTLVVSNTIAPAQVAYLSPEVPETIILREDLR